MPIYRQATDYAMCSLPLSKQVMLHWVNTITLEKLALVADHMAVVLVALRYVQCDETYILVNRDGRSAGHKSFM